MLTSILSPRKALVLTQIDFGVLKNKNRPPLSFTGQPKLLKTMRREEISERLR